MTEVNATQKLSAAEELKTLADKFLASKGVATKSEDTKQVDVPQNVLIAVPCFAGNVCYRTVNLLMGLNGCLSKAGIPHETHFTTNESLITRARNYLASVAAFGHDSAGRQFSHLMFVDADIYFTPQYILRMLDAKVPIIALPY